MSESLASIVTLIAVAIGLFYLIGGVVHMRASGISLMALSRWTLPIFTVNAVLQGAYLIWATRAFPPIDETGRQCRRATRRALLFYLAAFGLVIALDRLGLWRIWIQPAAIELVVIAVLAVALSWLFRRRSRPASKVTPATSQPTPPDRPPADAPLPERLRLAPEYHCGPLWDDERGTMVDPAGLGLSPELLERIADWNAAFEATFREDDPSVSGFADVAAERTWVEQGNAIAQDLAQEWPGPFSNQISALTMLLRDARDGLGTWDELPEDRIAWIGGLCGVAEIEHAIGWLNALSREREALPEWDGDSQDDIARTQALLHGILARVPGRYTEVVSSGLRSPEWRTRSHVALALVGHDRAAALPILRDALAREVDDLARQLMTMTLAQLEADGT